jgi:hypothetical protein
MPIVIFGETVVAVTMLFLSSLLKSTAPHCPAFAPFENRTTSNAAIETIRFNWGRVSWLGAQPQSLLVFLESLQRLFVMAALRLSGKTYYLSVLNDAYTEPRWRPDWMSPSYLMADIYGRLQGSLQRLGDAVPETWRKKLEDTQAVVLKDGPALGADISFSASRVGTPS